MPSGRSAGSLAGRSVALFGGSGFIGRRVAAELVARGASLRVASRSPRSPDQMRYRRGDAAGIDAILDGVDGVVHLIGILAPHGSDDFMAAHCDGPAAIAAAAQQRGIEDFVLISAIGADPASPAAYARSKAAGELAVRAACPAARILRPSIVVGPGDGFFGLFSRMARFSPLLPLIGGGHSKFQPVYVGDVAAAVAICLARPETRGGLYELGGPEVLDFRRLLEMMLRASHRRRWLVPMPWSVARLEARLFELLPRPLLTRDQLKMLQRDNVVAAGARGLGDLGIEPVPVDAVLREIFG